MGFDFGRMERIAPRLTKWWEGEPQDRPCILCTIPPQSNTSVDTGESDLDLETWWTDPTLRVAEARERIDRSSFAGEAVPHHYADFGSSAMAAMLGARMEFVDRETVWAHPVCATLEQATEIAVDPENRHYKYVKSLTMRSAASGHRHHFTTLFALGAPGDTLAALYGTERLLIDMLERPERVKTAMRHMNRIWIEQFREFNRLIAASGNSGTVGWAGVWAPGTTFPMQEDYSYMISPEMFREFCLPHIADFVDGMDYPMYHLDGSGAIGHLEALLELPDLKVIQWVPGAGHERIDQWYELIRRIIDTGRSVQLFVQTREIEPLVATLGPRGLLLTVTDPTPANAEYLSRLYDLG